MTELQLQSALAALQAAAESVYGTIIHIEAFGKPLVSASLRAKGVLYQVRQKFPSSDFKRIQIRISPDNPETELWLVKLAEPEPETASVSATSTRGPSGPIEW